METKVNKAQEKRIRDAKESLSHSLRRELINFKERFLKSYVEFMYYKNFKMEILKLEKEEYKPGRFSFHSLEDFEKHMAARIESIKQYESRKYTNDLQFLVEANENYNGKFNKMVDALISHGVMAYPLRIEKIGSATSDDFGFLITHNEVVVHARVIFACGDINAPHYRFIITKRVEK